MVYNLTKKTKTARIDFYRKESKGRSNKFKRGLMMGLIVGSEGEEREFFKKKLNKNKKIKTNEK